MRGFWIVLGLGLAVAGPALAHPGHTAASDLMSGFVHPLSGLDHLLAMVAVGLLAARLGGSARWSAPAAFLSLAAVGGVMSAARVGLPFVELGVAASVLLLGLVITSRRRLSTLAAASFVGGLAVFHGYAHGAEMPADGSGLAHGAGFLAATALLLLAGVAAGTAFNGRRTAQVVGGALALAGMALLAT